MTTTWSASTTCAEGQVFVVETRVIGLDAGGFKLTLLTSNPLFTLSCSYHNGTFHCAVPPFDNLLAAEELDMYPLERTYLVRITLRAPAAGEVTAQWNIAEGNANLESSSLTAL